jgi:gamma-glutamylputrescine oxidase
LLEAQTIGAGASGRAGGLVLAGYTAGYDSLVKAAGPENAQKLWHFSCNSVDRTKELITQHRIACDWQTGTLTAALTLSHFDAMRREADALHKLSPDWHEPIVLDRVAMQAHIASNRYVGGILDPNTGHLHPLNLTLGLARAAYASGAQLFCQTPVLAIDFDSGRVQTRQGIVHAHHIILATNVFSEQLVSELGRYLLPASTFMAATQPLGAEKINALLPSRLGVADSAFVMDYFRPTADHRLLFGGGISYGRLETKVIAQKLHKRLVRIFPELATTAFSHSWSGALDISFTRQLIAKRLGRCGWTVLGFSGHGLALTVGCGAMLVEAIQGNQDIFQILSGVKPSIFPGPRFLRGPATTVGVKAHQMLDWFKR